MTKVIDSQYDKAYMKTETIYDGKGLKIIKKDTSGDYLLIINTEKELYVCIENTSLGYKTVDLVQYENTMTISNFVSITDMNTLLHTINEELSEQNIKISYKLLIEQIEKSGVIKYIGYNKVYETLKNEVSLDLDSISIITEFLV